METVELSSGEVEQRETCPNCGALALRNGEKTDLDGRVLAEFYECRDPECRCTWWVEGRD
ncbi:MAG TPA: hypothetical protein VKM69_05800 [Natronoarchaeum rubrum]|nr:hypothetical protein [Natronoarchaeum rubrum]